jgi:hypothetical protein
MSISSRHLMCNLINERLFQWETYRQIRCATEEWMSYNFSSVQDRRTISVNPHTKSMPQNWLVTSEMACGATYRPKLLFRSFLRSLQKSWKKPKTVRDSKEMSKKYWQKNRCHDSNWWHLICSTMLPRSQNFTFCPIRVSQNRLKHEIGER